jgi:hypothetical protein
MKKNIVKIIVAVVILGTIVFYFTTRKTQRDYVEDLQRQLPNAIAFVKENQDLLNILLEAKERLNEYQEENNMEITSCSIRHGIGDEKQFGINMYYRPSLTADDEGVEPFSEEEIERINQVQEPVFISISPYVIHITYAESGLASLSIYHPIMAIGQNGRGEGNSWYNWYDEKDYSYFWYNEIVDENWYIEIYNSPRG